MKRRNNLLTISCLILLLSLLTTQLYAYSAGGTKIFEQPNGVTFKGTWLDSEISFSWLNATEDGYVFIDGPGNYYYYATLGPNGNYVATSYKVGIDNPPSESYCLERTGFALDTYQTQLDSFNCLCLEQNQYYLDNANRDFETFFAAVICVDFSWVGPDSIQCRQNQNPRYTKSNFEDMLESQGYYHTGLYGVTSPDDEEVYGSFKDYWKEVTNWSVVTETGIVNPAINDSIQWITYPGYVDYCTLINYAQNQTVTEWAVAYADSMGWLPANTEYVIIVGAGVNWDWVEGQGWHIIAPVGGLGLPSFNYTNSGTGMSIQGAFTSYERWDDWGTWYQNPPLHLRYFNQPNPPHEYHFDNIGMYCHEAGHAYFGWTHSPTNTHSWNLMISGTNCGNGACPTPPSPVLLTSMGWIDLVQLTQNQTVEFGYDPQFTTQISPEGTPKIYYINGTQPANLWQDSYIIINARYTSFYSFAPGNPNEPGIYTTPNPENNLLITHKPLDPTSVGMGYSHTENGNNLLGRSTDPEGNSFPGSTGRDYLLPSDDDPDVFDTRSVVNSSTYFWDGVYQEGVCLKNIVSDAQANCIRADVYCNYWEGNLDDAPGGAYLPIPIATVTWSGDDIILGGDVTVSDYQDLVIENGSVITAENNACLRSLGQTIFGKTEIAADICLEGKFQINDTLRVTNGAVLTIRPDTTLTDGTQLEFAANAVLLIDGGLVAVDESGQNPISFKRLNEDLPWEGIVIDNQTSSYSYPSCLDHCIITGANVGLKTISAYDLQVQNCSFSGNTAGVYYIHCNAGGDPSFRGNNFIANQYGLVLFGGAFEHDAEMLENNFIDNESYAIFMHSGNTYPIGDNYITGSNVGIVCRNYTHSNLCYHEITHEEGGYNTLTGNDFGIKILDGSTPYLGQIEYGFYGLNNYTNTRRYDLWNTNPHVLIMAEDNWWQADPPDSNSIFCHPTMVDFNPWSNSYNYRTDDPLLRRSNQPVYCENLWEKIADATGLVYTGQYDQAIEIYTYILERYPNSIQAAQALEGLYWAEGHINGIPRLIQQIGSIESTLPSTLIELSQFLNIRAYLETGNPQEAFNIASELSNTAEQENLRILSTFALGYITKHYLDDQSQGNDYFEEFIERFPKDELATVAALELGLERITETAGNNLSGFDLQIPNQYALQQNYPNPFNPVTTIPFEIADNENVTLTIFNVEGKIVATLVDGTQSAGKHSAVWKTNDVPSGVYFCRLKADDFQQTIKMILIK